MKKLLFMYFSFLLFPARIYALSPIPLCVENCPKKVLEKSLNAVVYILPFLALVFFIMTILFVVFYATNRNNPSWKKTYKKRLSVSFTLFLVGITLSGLLLFAV